MEEIKFIYSEHPEAKGRIDDKSNLTWNEISFLLKKYSEKLYKSGVLDGVSIHFECEKAATNFPCEKQCEHCREMEVYEY